MVTDRLLGFAALAATAAPTYVAVEALFVLALASLPAMGLSPGVAR